jgi:spectinomycin phosphotransferase
LPKFLSDQGIRQIIAPLPTRQGQLWADLAPFTMILYPFVAGRDGYQADLTDRQWISLGAALQAIHTTHLPPALAQRIPPERFAPRWREVARAFLARIEAETFAEPVAVQLAVLLQTKRSEISGLLAHAERLAQALQAHTPPFVLCHADLHAGNVLLPDETGLYIVDWDAPICAPKERDLMFAGGGQFGNARTAAEEEMLFYQGYGPAVVDQYALAYYRYERIIEDIAAFCEQIFGGDAGGEDREQALRYLASNFLPGGTIETAYRGDKVGHVPGICEMPGTWREHVGE